MTTIKYQGLFQTIYGIGLAAAVFVAGCGCASIPVPSEQMAVS